MNQSMNKVFLERLTNAQKQKLSAIIKLLLGVVTAIRICSTNFVQQKLETDLDASCCFHDVVLLSTALSSMLKNKPVQ